MTDHASSSPNSGLDTDAIRIVGFDADDTLWHSETFFAVTEDRFRALLAPWCEPEEVSGRLLDRERSNLHVFGYGIKGFTLSMLETAIDASDGAIPVGALQQIVNWGKEMLAHPVELIDDVERVLDVVGSSFELVLITKGDLFHQESKIAESGLAERFQSIDVLAEKSRETYSKVLHRLGAEPGEFLMVGNSVRSDVLPIIEIGGQAVHVPYSVTWGHEQIPQEESVDHTGWPTLGGLPELLPLLDL